MMDTAMKNYKWLHDVLHPAMLWQVAHYRKLTRPATDEPSRAEQSLVYRLNAQSKESKIEDFMLK